MFDRGRHDRHTAQHQASRYRLRAGMAKVALRMRREGPVTDGYGKPLRHAAEMAERHSERTLERWADRDRRKLFVSMS